ncbi:hypothetical protein C4J81_18370 [Deltaproteobacteria bacterium Smac51]|nr:hypothetical protein C4J81_18370 [Deltaproteobacteria bacterium Smac51]
MKEKMALALLVSFFVWLGATCALGLADSAERVEITTQKLPTGRTTYQTLPAASEAAEPPTETKTYSPTARPPFTGRLKMQLTEGVMRFSCSFNSPAVRDASIINKDLAAFEMPFQVKGPMKVRAKWTSTNDLTIAVTQTRRELEQLLLTEKVFIEWDENFLSADGRRLHSITVIDPEEKSRPFRMSRSKNKPDKGFNHARELGLEPFSVSVEKHTNNETYASLEIRFNRAMVENDKIRRDLELSAVPVTIDPPLPLKVYWKNDRTLYLYSEFTRDGFWERISDQPFTVHCQDNLKSLDGEQIVLESGRPSQTQFGKPFYFHTFDMAGFKQSGMDLESQAEFDLIFNKPVDPEEVARQVRVEKLVVPLLKAADGGFVAEDAEEWRPVPVEVLGVGGRLDEYGQIASLRVKAKSGNKLRVVVERLKSADGRGLITDRAAYATVSDFFEIGNTSTGVEDRYPWKPYFNIDVSEPVNFNDPQRPVHKYIKLEPPAEFSVVPHGREGRTIQIFAPFSSSIPTKVTLLTGLPSQRGVLTEDVSFEVRASAKSDRRLMFTGRGRYLSPEKPLLVKMAGRNVDRVKLQGWRIYENNLPVIINVQDYDSNLRTRLAQQFSKNVISRATDTGAPAGDTFERLIDLKQVLNDDSEPAGAYLLKITPMSKGERSDDGEYDDYDYEDYYNYSDYYYHTERYLPVMISDLGLSAHVLDTKVTMWVNSLSKAAPVAGGTVKFYDRANQVIAQGTTDGEGLFTADLPPGRAVFVTVEKNGDLNYMTFGRHPRTNWESSDYDVYDSDYYDDYYDDYYANWHDSGDAKWYGGDAGYLKVDLPPEDGDERNYLMRGYEAFLFMPRDIFKPGETIKVKAMVRDRDIMPPREPFPVIWQVTDPDGRVISQGRADMNENGGLDFASEIPFSGRTGQYEAAISVPGSQSVLGLIKFTVEDFVPPRLAIDLKTDKKIYAEANPVMELSSEVKYLFGAPGTNLKWEVDALITPAAFNPGGWEGFDFSSPFGFEATRRNMARKGTLDENGRVTVQYQPDLENKRLPDKMTVQFIFRAQEDGGRWNAKKTAVDYFPRPAILGGKGPEQATVDQEFIYEAAVVDPEGNPVETGPLEFQISKVEERYYNTYRYGRSYRQSVSELVPQTKGSLKLNEGRGSIKYTPPSSGIFEISISDPKNDLAITRRINVYGLGVAQEASPQVKGRVELSFDRPSYLPGDEALVKIKSPFPGRLWLTVETTSQLYSKTMNLESTEAEVRIPVNSAIISTAYVSATVVRPLAEGVTNYRAIGLGRLEIDRERYRLQVQADLPGHIKPAEKTRFKIKLSDASGRPLAGEATVSLVDEGVLSLTGFKTPDPWKMFTVGRKLMTIFYDLYDQLLPLEKTTVPFLIPGGGDGIGRAGLFSPFKRNQEVLSIFLATVEIGPEGEAEVELDLPEYSGQGRLMVVASSGQKFGRTSKSVRISRDLTAEATLPLALAPGDRFEIPIRAFLAAEAAPEAGLEASISIKTEGPIRLLDKKEATFNLSPGEGQTEIFQALAEPEESGGDQAGIGRLIIESQSGLGETFSQTIEAVVRPPYPRMTVASSARIAAGDTEISFDAGPYLKGTVEASLTMAPSPAVEAARAVRYLGDYPYGCLEQTTSKAWVYIAAGEMLGSQETGPDREAQVAKGLDAAVKRLAIMQTYNGGFSYWPGQESVYEWGTVYAAHFLTEAGRRMDLPSGLKENALKWLEYYLSADYGLSSDINYGLSVRSYAVYVLALNGQYRAGWVNTLKDRYESLSPSARIFLAGAIAVHEGNPRALNQLNNMELALNTLNHQRSSLESHARNLALQLMVWNEVDPLSPEAAQLASNVSELGRGGRWTNTQENGMAVYALATWLKKSGTNQPYTATLTDVHKKTIFTVTDKQIGSAGPKALAAISDGPLNLHMEGKGQAYYTFTVAATPIAAPEPKADFIKLTRTWTLPGDETRDLTETFEPIKLKKGDRVNVTITANSLVPLQNMVLADLLPGGFEIENPRLVTPSGEDSSHPSSDSRLELREDRLIVIEPYIDGETTYSYTLRAVTSGEYALPPTIAEGMYEPHCQAITSGGKVIVE